MSSVRDKKSKIFAESPEASRSTNGTGLSFFAKESYFKKDQRREGLYLQRVSGIIRAKQIAEYLDAKYNPKEGYENDVRIYIKLPVKLDQIKDGAYIDVGDDQRLVELLKTRPGLKVLAISRPHYEWLKSILKNEVILIPVYHLNFENVRRERKEIINCGYIGSIGANSAYHIGVQNEVGKRLAEAGFNFISFFDFKTREDNINYYKQIDLQIIGYFDYYRDVPFYHPTKIINAMSFGIPTIAGPRLGFKDVDGFYIPANSMDELVKEAKRMREPEQYGQWPEKLIKKAEEYHISKIAELYRVLK